MNSSSHYFQSTLGQDIQDPTDFPAASNAPGLRDLDESLRCKICSEIYSAPMSLNCGHSFCSLVSSNLSEISQNSRLPPNQCIRSHLSEKPECPICRQSSTDFNLRRNQSLEDVVRAWTVARYVSSSCFVCASRHWATLTWRPFVLGLCKDIEACRNDSISKTPSPSRRRSPSKPTPRKRKRSSYSDDGDDVVELVGSQLEESQIDGDISARSLCSCAYL